MQEWDTSLSDTGLPVAGSNPAKPLSVSAPPAFDMSTFMATLNRIQKELTHEGRRPSGSIRWPSLNARSCPASCGSRNSTRTARPSARIAELVKAVPAEDVARVAIQAKEDMRLRHVPLLLARELMRTKEGRALAKDLFPRVILRPDDITEFLAIYWKDNKDEPLAKQVKKWLGESFRKFDEYQLAKYNGGRKAVKLRDAVRITRPKPTGDAQAELWRKLVKGELATPDTWEVELSKGCDKKATFERLMSERRLGTLAFLRNLRNMHQSGVDKDTVAAYAQTAKIDRILPFQFVAAAKAVAAWEDLVEEMLLRCLDGQPKIPGKTVLVVDTSGSMAARLGAKSEMTRMDVAAALAILAREICEEPVIYCTAGDDCKRTHATMLIPLAGVSPCRTMSPDRR